MTLSVDDIAENLNINQQTVRRWISENRLKATRYWQKAGWRIELDDYDEFLAENPRYRNRSGVDNLSLSKRLIYKKMLEGLHEIQSEYLMVDHGKSYSEGWNDAMIAFDNLIKENLIEPE